MYLPPFLLVVIVSLVLPSLSALVALSYSGSSAISLRRRQIAAAPSFHLESADRNLMDARSVSLPNPSRQPRTKHFTYPSTQQVCPNSEPMRTLVFFTGTAQCRRELSTGMKDARECWNAGGSFYLCGHIERPFDEGRGCLHIKEALQQRMVGGECFLKQRSSLGSKRKKLEREPGEG